MQEKGEMCMMPCRRERIEGLGHGHPHPCDWRLHFFEPPGAACPGHLLQGLGGRPNASQGQETEGAAGECICPGNVLCVCVRARACACASVRVCMCAHAFL